MEKINYRKLIIELNEYAYDSLFNNILNNALERISLMDNTDCTFSDWLPNRSCNEPNESLMRTSGTMSKIVLSSNADDEDRAELYKNVVDAVDEITCTSKDLVLAWNNEYLTLYRI